MTSWLGLVGREAATMAQAWPGKSVVFIRVGDGIYRLPELVDWIIQSLLLVDRDWIVLPHLSIDRSQFRLAEITVKKTLKVEKIHVNFSVTWPVSFIGKYICHSFLMLHCRRMPWECKYIVLWWVWWPLITTWHDMCWMNHYCSLHWPCWRWPHFDSRMSMRTLLYPMTLNRCMKDCFRM